jgi:hypothetical protein
MDYYGLWISSALQALKGDSSERERERERMRWEFV